MPSNPFTYGKPIQNPARFFGRQEAVRKIFNALKADQNVSLVGERRIGKTSLLQYISNPGVRAQNELSPQKSYFIFVDFQEKAKGYTAADFWREILNSLSTQVHAPEISARLEQALAKPDPDSAGLAQVLDEFSSRGQSLVLLLDEIENAAQQLEFGADFFGGLRSLASHRAMTLLISSCCELNEKFAPTFFNIFSVLHLGPFSRPEAEALVYGSLPDGNAGATFDPREVEAALAWSGLHPVFLQMACACLWDAHERGSLALPERLGFAREQFFEQSDAHFRYYWDQSSEPEPPLTS